MNTIRNLSILFSALITSMVVAALVLQDPLIMKCESVSKALSIIEREDPHRPSLTECKRLLHGAVCYINQAKRLEAERRRIINQSVLSYYQGRDLKQMQLHSMELRSRADSLLDKASVDMHRLPPAL